MPGFLVRLCLFSVLFPIHPVLAESPAYTPSPRNFQTREWFQDAKFGLFIHWGVYSVLGRGEWVMQQEKMPIAEYEKLPPQFNPVEFDPDAWCRMARSAGMQYITITSKHHDGFALFDSKVSDYDIVDRTPHGKDVLKQLAEACRKHGLKLFFYHSHLDWHHPDYFPRGATAWENGRPDEGDWTKYLDYMDSQLAELCTNYGPIGGIWFDGWWDKPDADWRLSRTYGLIHKLQPHALIGNNHHRAPFPGEDFQMFEKGLPGADPFSQSKHVSELPLETCETINNSWGYNAGDSKHKSAKEIIRLLVNAAGMNANLLLNVGPKPDGTIQAEHQERLAEVGRWLNENGESIYGSRGGRIPPQPWGVTTQRGKIIYAHVLDEKAEFITLPGLKGTIVSISQLHNGPVQYEVVDEGILVKLPKAMERDPVDTILVVEMEESIK